MGVEINDFEIKSQVKKEVNTGISYVIAKIFATVLELIDITVKKVKIHYENRRIRKTMNYIVNATLLQYYLNENNFDCIMHTTHNGLYSEAGFGYKYVRPIFTCVKSNNKMLDLFCNDSSPASLYTKWMWYCIQCFDMMKPDFDEKMRAYFMDYDKVFWRKHRTVFYCILSGDAILTDKHEKYINMIIDNLLDL